MRFITKTKRIIQDKSGKVKRINIDRNGFSIFEIMPSNMLSTEASFLEDLHVLRTKDQNYETKEGRKVAGIDSAKMRGIEEGIAKRLKQVPVFTTISDPIEYLGKNVYITGRKYRTMGVGRKQFEQTIEASGVETLTITKPYKRVRDYFKK